MKPLSIDQFELARRKTLSNAEALLDEAKLLYKHKKYARAYALAHLACEEAAKIFMLARGELELLLGRPIDWKKLGRRLHSHSEKINNWHYADYLQSDVYLDNRDLKQLEEAIDKTSILNDAKNTSLYTSINADEVVEPNECISDELSQTMIRYSSIRIDWIKVQESKSLGMFEKLPKESLERLATLLDMFK